MVHGEEEKADYSLRGVLLDHSLRGVFLAGFDLKRVFVGKFSSYAPPLLVGRRASGDGKAGKAWIGASPTG